MKFGALETGGTKMVCAVGLEDGTIIDRVSIKTGNPDETVSEIVDYFSDKDIASLGIATFGPVDLNKESSTYGYILKTPKLAWANYDLLGNLKKSLDVPMEIDTDVNGACLGEMTFGCAKGQKNVIYVTIGTGIGVGISIDGKLVHGMLHSEGGHILLTRHPDDDFECICPFHRNCFEGIASGPAIEKRFGVPAKMLASNAFTWELESYYIAQALMTYILTISPTKIILGGGVMHQTQLFSMIRKKTLEMINGYVSAKELDNIDEYIVPAALDDNQGILGAIQLAKWAKGIR